ncbi:MAG TPA: molybdopterin-dependent oxidoreductase [Gammaproteobacteria bacterium]|nr:molybdopterin-dependent oxidoreductase [Gammaproteobacteria bacterium]
MLRIRINGATHELDVAEDTPLLWVLRDTLSLKGTKYGCGVGICGICTVLADGQVLRSCVAPVGEVAGREITTIEGLAERGHPLLSAWVEGQVPQCGYCQPGQILSAVALLKEHAVPSDAEIDTAMGDVLCRCGTYQRIRRAVHAAAREQPDATPELVASPAAPAAGREVTLDDWIRIAPDGTVTVQINHSEMGQGVTTALAMLIGEELEVDPARIRTEFAPAAPRYRNPIFDEQTTGGSTSVRGEWERLSEAGARARVRLIKAAAQRWRVRQKDCTAEDGTVVHRPSGWRLGYGELAEAAARVDAPKRVTLKPAGSRRWVGHALARLDIPDMATGRTVYGMDVTLPDLRVASIERCPVIGGGVASFDASGVNSVPGVERVVEMSHGVAVVARDSWSALQGRKALHVEWEAGPNRDLDSAAIDAQLRAALERDGEVQYKAGRNPRQAGRIVEAEYVTAPLAHATLEPMNCTARITDGLCEVWIGTQSQEATRDTAAEVSGLPRSQVRVHSQFLGGGFGRRLETDMVAEAVALAQAVEAPVQVIWTRPDDMQHDFYRPAHRARLRAALDRDGWPLAWWQRSAGAELAGDVFAELPYAVRNRRSEFVEVDSPLPAGAWRSVGAGQDAFVMESFIDELAGAAGRDPFEYRRALLQHAPRHLAVLERAAEAADWGEPLPGARHRGIAVYSCFGSYVAQVAEVSVHDGQVRVHRVVCAVDCGRLVNPDIVRAQIEGGVAFGLSAALKEAVSVQHGRVQQATFEDYPILTLPEMPEVEVHITESDEAPGGVGEPGVPPIAPAVANAVAAATGVRLRALPLRIPEGASGE